MKSEFNFCGFTFPQTECCFMWNDVVTCIYKWTDLGRLGTGYPCLHYPLSLISEVQYISAGTEICVPIRRGLLYACPNYAVSTGNGLGQKSDVLKVGVLSMKFENFLQSGAGTENQLVCCTTSKSY